MELALSVPQVFAHRATRMALTGPKLSERDRKEFQIMVNEKHAAFAQAWNDMAMHAFRANQAFTASMLRFFFTPFSYRKPSAAFTAAQVQNAVIGMLGKGLGLFTAKPFRMPGGLLKLNFANSPTRLAS